MPQTLAILTKVFRVPPLRPGPFAASADLFTALVAELQGPEAAGLTACELEELLAGRGREVLRQLLQDHLDLRAAREQQAAREHGTGAAGADGITRGRLETGHSRQLATSPANTSGSTPAPPKAGTPSGPDQTVGIGYIWAARPGAFACS